QRAAGPGEARLLRGGDRRRARAQADLDHDAAAGERVAQVLRLRRPLRRPADDADLADALEGVDEAREEMASAADDVFRRAGQLQRLLLEDLGAEGAQGGRHGSAAPRLARVRPVGSLAFNRAVQRAPSLL